MGDGAAFPSVTSSGENLRHHNVMWCGYITAPVAKAFSYASGQRSAAGVGGTSVGVVNGLDLFPPTSNIEMKYLLLQIFAVKNIFLKRLEHGELERPNRTQKANKTEQDVIGPILKSRLR